MVRPIKSTYYKHAGNFCDHFSKGLENTCRLLKLFESGGRIGAYSLQLQSKSHPGITNMFTAFDTAGAAVSSIRSLLTLERILSGKMFWRHDDSTGEFFRAKVDSATNSYVYGEDGDYIKDPNGIKVPQDFISLAIDVSLAVGRFFSTALYFSKLGLYNLGKHAHWMGSLVLSAFTIVVTLCGISSVYGLIQTELDSIKMKKRIADVLSGIFDILAFPWDAGLGFNSHPAMALTGAIISALSAGGYLLKEWVYFNIGAEEAPIGTTL